MTEWDGRSSARSFFTGELNDLTLNLGILLAFACAVATQLGFLYKHRGACSAAKVDIRRPLKTVKSLFSSRWFAIGMLVALGAWVLHVAAMALAPISVVQAVLSTGVVLATLSRRPYHGHDVFGMVPPPGASDSFDAHARYHQIAGGQVRGPGGDPYFGYRHDLLGTVTETFAGFGLRDVTLH